MNDQAKTGRSRIRHVLLATLALFLALALAVGILIGAVVALRAWAPEVLKPDTVLPILVLVAVVVFIGALTYMASLFKYQGLEETRFALGLPEGSVRAIIALMLVFLFFVAAIFVYGSTLTTEVHKLDGLTPEQFRQIPPGDLVASTPHPADNPTSYDVDIRAERSEATTQLGSQLIVLLGTLVTAVASFYFGSNSALSAQRSMRG